MVHLETQMQNPHSVNRTSRGRVLAVALCGSFLGVLVPVVSLVGGGCSTSSSNPFATPTPYPATVFASLDYTGTLTGTYEIYGKWGSRSSTCGDSQSWTALGSVSGTAFPVMENLAFHAHTHTTYYACFYWSVSGSGSGPQLGDPAGTASFQTLGGDPPISTFSVNVTLQ